MSYSLALDEIEDDSFISQDFPSDSNEYQKSSRLRRERGRKQKTQKHTSASNSKALRGKSANIMFVDDGYWN